MLGYFMQSTSLSTFSLILNELLKINPIHFDDIQKYFKGMPSGSLSRM